MARVLSLKSAMRKALVLSLGVHAAIFGVARPLVLHSAAAAPVPTVAGDRWTGDTAELPGAGQALYDVSLDRPASPPPPPPPSPAPADPAPAPPAAVPALGDVPVPAPPPVPSPKVAQAPPRPRPSATASASSAEPAADPPPPKRRARPPGDTAVASASSPGVPGGGGGSFGAEGAASVRDLGRAFTRAIPPASDSDPVWATVPLGDAGKLEVAVHVDETGHITSAEPRGDSPPKALASLLRRTVPMLQAGTFAVREGGVSEGTETLELRAVVTEVGIPSGDSADTSDRLSWKYDRGRGKAGFTQLNGRHVEISVRVLRVESR